MKIHIVLYERKEFGDYKYNYYVIITIEEEGGSIIYNEFFEKKPGLKKKLTKNVIKHIKTMGVSYLRRGYLYGSWKKVLNIRYEI